VWIGWFCEGLPPPMRKACTATEYHHAASRAGYDRPSCQAT
jgi:hypothetical protein